MNILITGIGGPTSRSVAIALKQYSAYKPYALVAADVNPLSIGLYQRHLFDASYVVPDAAGTDYWTSIDRIVSENRIEYAFVLPDREVMVWSRRAKEGRLPCPALLPELAMTEVLADKARTTLALNTFGAAPPSISFSRDSRNLTDVADLLGFPFWVRSTSGSSGSGSLKVESRNDLTSWININADVRYFLASRFLSGRNLACKMLYYEGRLLRAACAERVNYIMSKVAPSGITGNTSFGRFLNEPKMVALARTAMDHLFAETGSSKHGFFTVDLKEDENRRAYVTEVNTRHVAFTQCFAAAGANFAEDTIRLLDGDPGFKREFMMYEFEDDLIFLRDVDSLPVLMKEGQLLK